MYINKISSNDNFRYKQNKHLNFNAADFMVVKELTQELSKKIYSKEGVMSLYKKYPKAEGITIGSTGIPNQWLKRIEDLGNFDLPNFCEQLGHIFMRDRHYSNLDTINKNMLHLFKTHKIINNEDNFSVSYLGKGFFGRAYKIAINEEPALVIKEYKRSYRYQNNHGNFAEQNIAEYIDRYSEKNSNMVKYYYGDMKNGIMIMDYISKDTALPLNKIELDELGLSYADDKPKNYVNNYIIDYGGIITINNLVGNIKAQNVYRKFKYLNDDAKKIELFETLYNDKENENYIDQMIGLTHSIVFMPQKNREELYKKMFILNDDNINIALIENVKNFDYEYKNNEIIQTLIKTDNPKIKKIIAREIRHFTADVTHSLIEKYSLEDNNHIKKYIARNLNYYYKYPQKRIEIFDNLMQNANQYTIITLINSLNNLPTVERDLRFEKFYNMDNVVVKSALARNIELFNNNLNLMKKWINKLLKVEHVIVKRALCETVRYLPEDLMPQLFVELLDVKDMNAKEYLAETLPYIRGFANNPDWFEKINNKSCNSVKRELAKILDKVGSPLYRKQWSEMLYQTGDSSVKDILKQQKLI